MLIKDLFESFEDMQAKAVIFDTQIPATHKWFWTRFYRHHLMNETAFAEPVAFYGVFFNQWEDSVNEYMKRKEVIDIMYKMGLADYTKDFQIGTFAQNPNIKTIAPSELLPYFNTQNYTETNMKPVEAYNRALSTIPAYIITEFATTFNHLLLSVLVDKEYMY